MQRTGIFTTMINNFVDSDFTILDMEEIDKETEIDDYPERSLTVQSSYSSIQDYYGSQYIESVMSEDLDRHLHSDGQYFF